jgi:phage terminase large subunit
VKSYIKDRTLYIRSELYKIGVEVKHLPTFFDQIEDARNYTILADNARPELINHMMGERFRIQAADKWAGCVEDRISFMRSFEQIVIHPDCQHTAEEFRLYSYKVDKRTNLILPEIVSLHDHCCDAIGYSLTPLIRKISNDYIL